MSEPEETPDESFDERTFAEGTLARRLFRIALPLTVAAAVRYGVELSNTYWVGKLGVEALSVVTALGTFMVLSRMFAGLVNAGTAAVVGRMVGEARARDALRAAQKVTSVALVFGVLVAAVGALISPLALDALGFQGETRHSASSYLYVLLAGLPFSFGMIAMEGVLCGLGKPRASMIGSSAALVVSFVMTPLLLWALHVGVWGAALGEVTGDICGYWVSLRFLRGYTGSHTLPFLDRFKELSDLVPILRVGAPLTVDALIHAAVWFGLIAYLSRYGTEYVAAQGAEERLTQILNVPTDGIAPAAATLVGYYLGKNQRAEALRVVWLALAVVGAVALSGAALLRVVPGRLVAFLCDDPSFVHVGAQMLAIAALGLIFLGARDVLEGAFGGVGNTLPPVAIGLVTALSRIPLAHLLAVKLGVGGLGVAWAVNGTLAVQTLVLGAWFFLSVRKRPAAPD